jgi:Holliday junction resolvase RusA-like endonuclease
LSLGLSVRERVYQSNIRAAAVWAFARAGFKEPWVGPVALDAVFWLSPRRKPDAKPDLTNLIYPVENALSGVVYQDDGQIVQSTQRKLRCPAGFKPCVDLTVRRIDRWQ